MQMVADWKLEVICKRLMEEIWHDRKEAIQEACIILKKYYQANMDKKTESITIQKKIVKTKNKIDNLIDLRTEGDITTEEYRSRRKKPEEELAGYELELEEQSLASETTPEDGLNWEKIKATLNEVIDFSGSKVDDSIVDKFVARIIPQGDNRFAWFINLSAMEPQQIDMAVEGRKNQPTVYIKEDKEETSEDGESSIHSNMLLVGDIALILQGKKSSPVPIPHIQHLINGHKPLCAHVRSHIHGRHAGVRQGTVVFSALAGRRSIFRDGNFRLGSIRRGNRFLPVCRAILVISCILPR